MRCAESGRMNGSRIRISASDTVPGDATGACWACKQLAINAKRAKQRYPGLIIDGCFGY
jgi:hypothetical protein